MRETEELRARTQQLEKRLEIAETKLAPVFKSKAMQEIHELINAMAPSEANVLITGESGVGKEVIANVIHSHSRRAAKAMVKLNCAAFPQAMIESELFGYVKGAFTGATNDFPGMIAAASGSTLFLDEISEMPAELQTRFLRVLQEREYRSLGSTKTLKADFRVVAATNRPIAQALAENRLREDLYYRLNTFQIEIPPLRERKEDIPPLVAFVRETLRSAAGQTGTGDRAGSVSEIARLQLARKRARTAKRHRVRGRPGPPRTNRNQGTARGSAVAGRAAAIAIATTGATRACKVSTTSNATRSSRPSPSAMATRRRPRRFSGFSARRFITR